MKVNIGPYIDWWNTAEVERKWLEFRHKDTHWKIDEDDYDGLDRFIIKFLDDVIQPILNVTINKRSQERKVKVKLINSDTWGMDDTLSHIIYPMLVQLQATKHGAPCVDNEDTPEELWGPVDEEGKLEQFSDVDENFFKRWDYVLNEMIFAFKLKSTRDWEEEYDWDYERLKPVYERMANGYRLFGKYYESLWD